MKKMLLLLFSFPLWLISNGQAPLPDFGVIDMADMTLTACPFEPTAPAMKLFEVHETSYDRSSYGSRLKMETRVRIKIFNTKGYEYASVRIPYLSKKGFAKIKELKGIIYNLDAGGKIVTERLEKKDFFKQKGDEIVKQVNFTFPGLKPGSVIEFTYTRIENDITLLEPWLIQAEIPCRYASLVMTTPVESFIKEKLFGADTIPRTERLVENGNSRRVVYFKENISSFKPEPYMSSRKDNIIRMIFFHLPIGGTAGRTNNTTPDVFWAAKGRSLLNSYSFGGQVDDSIPGTRSYIDSALHIPTLRNRVKYLFETVQKNILQKEEQTMYPDDLAEAWKSKAGNTAEINLILLNLLLKSGVVAYPFLVSTRENGKVSKDFPSFSQMNGVDVVAVIDSSSYYLLDASLKFQTFDSPPFNILNREVLLLQPDDIRWVMVSDQRPLLKQNINLFCEIRENGLIEGDASIQHYNYAKSFILDSTIDEDDKNDDKYFDTKTESLRILSKKTELPDNPEEPLLQTVSFTYEPQQTEDFFYINPQFLISKKKNPFTSNTRAADIDFGCNQEIALSLSLLLPAGFEVEHLPKNTTVRAPDSSFFYYRTYSCNTEYVNMNEVFKLNRPLYSKEEYEGLKESFARMYKLMNEELILKRKKK
ncbi:MAG: DUF3857 domain-containing protein [Chitinophagaceae bacterium]